MKKILSILLTSILLLGLSLPAHAMVPAYAEIVKINGVKEITMNVGDQLTLTAEAGCYGPYTYYYWRFPSTARKDIITLEGDKATIAEPSKGFNSTQSQATVTAISAGDITVSVHACPGDWHNFPESDDEEYWYNNTNIPYDTVTIHVVDTDSKAMSLSMKTQNGAENAKKEHGYIWSLELSPKKGAKADTLTATFETHTEKQVKTAKNVTEFFGGDGSVDFAVGLLTDKEITTFTAAVSDSSEPNVKAAAVWRIAFEKDS